MMVSDVGEESCGGWRSLSFIAVLRHPQASQRTPTITCTHDTVQRDEIMLIL